MGKRGPQKTPTEELARRGSWRAKEKARLNEIALPKKPEAPAAPKWLSKEATSHWAHITGLIFNYGLMREPDVVTVAMLCEAIAEYIRVRNDAATISPNETTGDGSKPHPIHKMKREAQQEVIRLIRELGMSPAARVGLIVEKPVQKTGEIVPMKRGGYAT